MLRCLCSASSISPAVYLTKATTTTRKMEDSELRPFRMTLLDNNKGCLAVCTAVPGPLGLFLPRRKEHKKDAGGFRPGIQVGGVDEYKVKIN